MTRPSAPPSPAALSHVDASQQPRMVDIGAKAITLRTATARARVRFPTEVAAALHAAGYVTPKGAVLTVAHIAGVMGAKATAQLIPLCHPLSLDKCDIAISMEGADLRGPLRDGASDEALLNLLRDIWIRRADRYSEDRAVRRQQNPHKIEMHYIGG